MNYKYRKKPVVVTAVQWRGNNPDEMVEVLGDLIDNEVYFHLDPIRLFINGIKVDKGNYVIKGIAGDVYQCTPEVFEAYHEMEGK